VDPGKYTPPLYGRIKRHDARWRAVVRTVGGRMITGGVGGWSVWGAFGLDRGTAAFLESEREKSLLSSEGP
jgi:hypothetical protein